MTAKFVKQHLDFANRWNTVDTVDPIYLYTCLELKSVFEFENLVVKFLIRSIKKEDFRNLIFLGFSKLSLVIEFYKKSTQILKVNDVNNFIKNSKNQNRMESYKT